MSKCQQVMGLQDGFMACQMMSRSVGLDMDDSDMAYDMRMEF